ncbi:MAG: hypothetical protein ABIP94_06675 [Planctomycetota bacterium]
MGLLRADLTALCNLPGTPAGRRLAASTAIGFLLVGLMSWWIAGELVQRPQLLMLVHGATGGDSLRRLLGSGLMSCPIAATWLGLALAQRQLFETPELTLWRLAPQPNWRGPVQVLLRASFLTVGWAMALAVPFLATLLANANAPPLAYCLVPVAATVCTVPLLCTLLAVQIVLVRFFAGRLLRLVLTVVAALASVAFSTWLLLGMFAPSQGRMQQLVETSAAADRLPWTIDTAALMLASAARGELDTTALRSGLGWLALALAIFWFAAKLHPRALERHLQAEPRLLRWRLRPWPSSVAATVRKKEFAQVLQQPGALIGFLVFGVLVFVLARERVLVSSILGNPRLPPVVAQLGAMLSLWFLAVLLVLYAHMGRLALWDGAQWSLYVASPAPKHSILRGKLEAVALFLLWPLVLVGAAGVHLLSASPAVLLTFVGVALGGTLAALGVLAIVGTSPRLMRPDDGGQIVQSGRSFVAAMLLVMLFELAVSPAVLGWMWLSDWLRRNQLQPEVAHEMAPWVVGSSLAFGLGVAVLGIAIGARNYRRLSMAR